MRGQSRQSPAPFQARLRRVPSRSKSTSKAFYGDPRREYYYSEFPNSEITITRFIAPTKEQRLNGSLKRQENSL
ncbi:hypothetical protein BKM03_15250 [Pseudomonas avellanae]|uniref:Uncharacterized protein n=1 Tax=Pseudomonas avellanae TaxID=46257 RepID=A0AAD0DYB3_9PSED|nr:hypothetical protein BKM03_15250 [Pseudomonas avellanae]POP86217.1 hypothetical protein CXB34_13240 [Pseudomonas amygdali pv. morsprunorum]